MALIRPTELECSIAVPRRATEKIGWSARVGIPEMVRRTLSETID